MLFRSASPKTRGWGELQPARSVDGIVGRTCFVACAFTDDVREAYFNAIKPALAATGYQSRCMLEIKVIEGITDRILAEIRACEIMVADFTHLRGGVYFEAGFAKGLGRPVVLSCRRDHIDQLHFDTRHLGHVIWTTHEELRNGLTDAIQANIISRRK